MKKTVKRMGSLLLFVCVAFVCTMNVFAEEEKAPVVYDSGTGYKAEKITHPEKDVMTADGIVDYTGNGTMGVNLEDGQGDRGQNYSWGSIGYGDYMYIGTCYGAWTSTLQFMKMSLGRNYDDTVMKEALDTYYHGNMYTGEEELRFLCLRNRRGRTRFLEMLLNSRISYIFAAQLIRFPASIRWIRKQTNVSRCMRA